MENKINIKIIRNRGRLFAFLICVCLLIQILPACSPAKAKEVLNGKTAMEITSEMGFGWNLGNTFDATGGSKSNVYSQETSWGNPKVTQELIKAVHDRGFKTIRIPVTWNNQLSKDGSYTINPDFLARVKEVVDYAYDLDMYIIINLHHEAWINTSKLSSNYESIRKELEAVWSQIADCFADYDQHLIFEGMNEPRLAGTDIEWSGDQAAYDAVNYLAQVFAYTIRSNGKGYNSERCLMIPGYAASSSKDILNTISIPSYEGKAIKNVIISVHCYSPYDFCLSDNLYEFDPNDKSHTYGIDTLFRDLEEMFLFNDSPVVIGETSATDKNNTEQRENWAEYMGRKSYEYGIPIILWDNGANGHSGGECHAWIQRNRCEWNYPSVVDKLFLASKSIDWGELVTTDRMAYQTSLEKKGILGGDIIYEDENGHNVAGLYLSHAQPISIPVIRYYIKSTSEIAVAYKGSASPLISINLGEKELYSGDIAPDRTEERDGYNIAFFGFRTINDTLTSAGIRNTSDSEMWIYSEGPDIYVYEVDVMALKPEVDFVVCGKSFSSKESAKAPQGLKIFGWYTTKDFREGTEYTGDESRNLTVYGMLFWEADEKAVEKFISLYGEEALNPTPEPTPEPTKEAQITPVPMDETAKKPTAKPAADEDKTDSPGDGSKQTGETVTEKEGSSDKADNTGNIVMPIILIILGMAVLASGTVVLVYVIKKKKNR